MARTASIDRKTAETDIQLHAGPRRLGPRRYRHRRRLLRPHADAVGQARGVSILTVQRQRRSARRSAPHGRRRRHLPSARRSSKRSATRPASAATATSRCRWKRRSSPSAIDLSGRYALVFKRRFPSRKNRRFRQRTGRRFLASRRRQRPVQPARARALRPQQPPHQRSHLQSHGPRAAHGDRTRSAHDRRAEHQGLAGRLIAR